MYNRVNIMGLPVDNLSISETLDIIEEKINKGLPCQHVVINAAKVVEASKNSQLRTIIEECEIINADGQSIVWASKLLNINLKERVAGIDLMEKLVELSAKKGYGLFFLGAKQEILDKVVEKYTAKYPGINISGAINGYYSAEEEDSVAQKIKDSKAKILFVAISSPKREIFLKTYRDVMSVPFIMGVGGSFDVVAGLTKRAPLWMQKFGLEWFYRLLQEPSRMWKRYLYGNTQFILLLLKELVFKKSIKN